MHRTTRRHRPGLRAQLAGPLFRWGFTLIAVTAAATHQTGAALVTGGFAWLTWRLHNSSRKGTRR